MLRPSVVLFGEMLPDEALSRLRQQLGLGFGLVVSIGTSSQFPYISAPIVQANQQGVPTVEINPDQTMITSMVDYHIALGAAEAMRELWPNAQENSCSS